MATAAKPLKRMKRTQVITYVAPTVSGRIEQLAQSAGISMSGMTERLLKRALAKA